MHPEVREAITKEKARWTGWHYSDGDPIIAWMGPLNKWHLYKYWKPNDDGSGGHLVHSPVRMYNQIPKIIVRTFVPYNDETKWLLKADMSDEPDTCWFESFVTWFRGLFL